MLWIKDSVERYTRVLVIHVYDLGIFNMDILERFDYEFEMERYM